MPAKKRIAVFQHLAVEHPGVFRDYLKEDDIQWQAFELDHGVALPDLENFDALWVMGGPMDVWEETQHPWLVAEKHAIRHAILELNKPFLGVCLGHQLFAAALGGAVGRSKHAEVGIKQIAFTPEGECHPVLNKLPHALDCLQWHSAEVKTIPKELTVLAESPACAVQALARESYQVSIQFHIEVTEHTVKEWGAVPAYATALEAALGSGALATFDATTAQHIDAFRANAKQLYDNWKSAAGF